MFIISTYLMGPGFMGWTSEIYLNKKKYQKMLEKIKKLLNLENYP